MKATLKVIGLFIFCFILVPAIFEIVLTPILYGILYLLGIK
jgi:hypothetical protein